MLKAQPDFQAIAKRYSQADGPVRRLTVKGKTLHILVPDVVQDDVAVRSAAEKLTHNSEKEDYIQELGTLARDLNFEPVIHLMRLSNIEAEIDDIPSEDLIMNVCDGSDIDGVPGPSVAAYLEKKNCSNVVGCDSIFIEKTLTKNGMKELFREHLVSTPPGFALTKKDNLAALTEEWGMTYPLFIKVSDSYGSVGLDDSSVCHTVEDAQRKCDELFKEFENLTVEEYIDGPEYSVLVSGNCRDENNPVIVYPPAERAFNKDLPRFKRFVSYIRNWDEAQYAHIYEPVADPNDCAALQDLARRAYAAVSGNCYGRVDVRKRDVSGKFYVLEVNASCGLGKGSSSEFILQLAGQTTQDFFAILLSSALKPIEIDDLETRVAATMTAEPTSSEEELHQEAGDVLAPVLPAKVEEKVAQLIRNPSLAVAPSPVVHVIVSAALIDREAGVPDPEEKLSLSYGKDAEYVSELEALFRNLYFDPIVHLFNVDDVEDVLSKLSKDDDLIFNTCLGPDGLEVAQLIEKHGFRHTIGLNAKFFEASRDRQSMREGLRNSRLRVPKGLTVRRGQAMEEIQSRMTDEGITFPVYLKPSTRQHVKEDSGQKVENEADLTTVTDALPEGQDWIIEEFINGSEYHVLIAGDGRDPFADLIVFPPLQFNAEKTTTNEPQGIMGLVRKISSMSLKPRSSIIGSIGQAQPAAERYSVMKQPDDLMLQMDLQDLARRAFVAVHGSCYGLVTIVDREDGTGLTVIGVSGDVRFGDGKSGTILRLAGQSLEGLFDWLLKRPVKAQT
ncbi:hypothetical protein HDU85_000097 [Gaertneriomyces sp. JEL0708]|nr:hypothetical protein HDU85_000097 [Gaertneriomyces sp. JEL0708]